MSNSFKDECDDDNDDNDNDDDDDDDDDGTSMILMIDDVECYDDTDLRWQLGTNISDMGC